MDSQIYADRHGRTYLLVATTKAMIYAWFRPTSHANDGYYDVWRKVTDMTQVQS
jgi:hypothetical protein